MYWILPLRGHVIRKSYGGKVKCIDFATLAFFIGILVGIEMMEWAGGGNR